MAVACNGHINMVFVFLVIFNFSDRISLCSPVWPQTPESSYLGLLSLEQQLWSHCTWLNKVMSKISKRKTQAQLMYLFRVCYLQGSAACCPPPILTHSLSPSHSPALCITTSSDQQVHQVPSAPGLQPTNPDPIGEVLLLSADHPMLPYHPVPLDSPKT